MQQDTASYDSLDSRPLPKWLTDQKEGLNTIQPLKMEMKDDHSLRTSLVLTSVFILFALAIVTVLILKKHKPKL